MLEEQLLMEKLSVVIELVRKKYGNDHNKRYLHIIGVVKMAKILAEKYHVSVIKAEIAAYFHDYYKYEDENTLLEHIPDAEMAKEAKEYPCLLHAYASAWALINEAGLDDAEIFLAIKKHVVGGINMTPLEKIIYVSDYTEENRTYQPCIDAREILFEAGLEKAISFIALKTVEHVSSQGLKVHPDQIKLYEEYKETNSNGIIETDY